MSAGGFMFGQASATYDSATYSTKRDWALELHRARCDAFYKAQRNEGQNWSTQSDGTGTWFSESRTVGSGNYTLKIRDLKPTSVDTTGEYPAFVTVWRHTNGYEYAIITSNGMKWGTGATPLINEMYIGGAHLPMDMSNSSRKYTFISFAHSFANNGFANYSFGSDILNDGELSVLPLCGFNGTTSNTSSATSNNSNGVVYNPAQGVTYSFGYAIRGAVIECFYRTSSYNANSGWNWSIIGQILSNPLSGNNAACYCYYGEGGEKDIITSNYYPRYSERACAFSCLDYNNKSFSGINNSNIIRYPRLAPCFYPSRCSTVSPSELPFSAGCLCICASSSVLYQESDAGIDGNGNCTAGLIDTDVLRIVARQACTVGGAIYQGGNFVVPCSQLGIANANDFSVILGWDASNESIV